jgi:hypothetical protein
MRMLDDIKPQPHPAAVAVRMFWTCAFATARMTDAFAARGHALWRQMLVPAGRRPLRPMPTGSPPSPPGDTADAAEGPAPSVVAPVAAAPQAEPTFASYRSDGGHASAQVIVLPR